MDVDSGRHLWTTWDFPDVIDAAITTLPAVRRGDLSDGKPAAPRCWYRATTAAARSPAL
jgi:hypothetical protein